MVYQSETWCLSPLGIQNSCSGGCTLRIAYVARHPICPVRRRMCLFWSSLAVKSRPRRMMIRQNVSFKVAFDARFHRPQYFRLSNRLLLTKSKSFWHTCANKVDYWIIQLNNGMQADIDSLDAFASYIETVKHEASESCHKRHFKRTKPSQKTFGFIAN